jgi:hypothetical protein
MMIHRKHPDPIQTNMFMHTLYCPGIKLVTYSVHCVKRSPKCLFTKGGKAHFKSFYDKVRFSSTWKSCYSLPTIPLTHGLTVLRMPRIGLMGILRSQKRGHDVGGPARTARRKMWVKSNYINYFSTIFLMYHCICKKNCIKIRWVVLKVYAYIRTDSRGRLCFILCYEVSAVNRSNSNTHLISIILPYITT